MIFSCGLFVGKNLSSCAERKQRHQLIIEALHQLHQDEFWDFWALIAFPFRYRRAELFDIWLSYVLQVFTGESFYNEHI